MRQLWLTWQLVPGQAECITNDLLVNAAPNLEKDLANGHSSRPVIERSLSLAHSHLRIVSVEHFLVLTGAGFLPHYR